MDKPFPAYQAKREVIGAPVPVLRESSFRSVSRCCTIVCWVKGVPWFCWSQAPVQHLSIGPCSRRKSPRSERTEHIVVPGAGHYIHEDEPKVVVNVIREMVQRIRAPK